jgi:hypothetical protein
MKTIKMFSLVMAVALVAAAKLSASDTSATNPFYGTLSAVSASKLPATAAELVSQADSKTRMDTTASVVKAAVGLNPAAAATVVEAIAKTTPGMASLAAATAVVLVPSQAIAIVRAAATAAPSEAGKIVEAVCRVVPNNYKAVADAVAGVAPSQSKEILAGVAAAIPALQDSINTVLAGSSSGALSVSYTLSMASPATQATPTTAEYGFNNTPAPALPAVHTGPPFVPVPPSPVNLDPGNGGVVPPGGQNYSHP